MKRGLLVAVLLSQAAPSAADQRPGLPATTTCSLEGRVCATRGTAGISVWRHGPGGGRRLLWRAATRARVVQVADDGRSLVEVQPWANLVEEDAGPDLSVFVFHRPGAAPVRVTLGEMVRDVGALPRTASHRSWARTFGYDGRGHFQVDTVEGRRLLFDPTTGRPVAD